jgi:hypothetical protein
MASARATYKDKKDISDGRRLNVDVDGQRQPSRVALAAMARAQDGRAWYMLIDLDGWCTIHMECTDRDNAIHVTLGVPMLPTGSLEAHDSQSSWQSKHTAC